MEEEGGERWSRRREMEQDGKKSTEYGVLVSSALLRMTAVPPVTSHSSPQEADFLLFFLFSREQNKNLKKWVERTERGT